jgi:hypothetical protein
MSRLHAAGFAVLVVAALAYVASQTRRDASAQATQTAALAAAASGGGQAASPEPAQSVEATVEPVAAVVAATEEPPPGTSLLPPNAPKNVTIGIVLVAYQGAQGAPDAAPSKPAALTRARELLAQAKLDFQAAVGKGDTGSLADAGRMPRGVLEPEIERAVFTLEPGNVFPDPLDTPRGYWIVKRLQ